ncbi:hypothetical protein [Lysinibacillus sp. NPDC059133]|uniref:hypothetical protein n=1 Tax=Lysinibacillus sp. NPDC059133 TaxID=3346737 RepID=UPI0036AA82C0
MKKPIKKTWMIASALTIGMAVLTPLQAGATSAEKQSKHQFKRNNKLKGLLKTSPSMV